MIRRFLNKWKTSTPPRVARTSRTYRLRTGQSVFLSENELDQLEKDYESAYGVRPIFRFHPHPALDQGQCLVSLNTEIR